MNFVPAGYPWMALSGVSAITVLAFAVWRRSWSNWLLGFVLVVLTVVVCFAFRAPTAPVTS